MLLLGPCFRVSKLWIPLIRFGTNPLLLQMQVGTKDLLEFRGEDKVFCIVISHLHICMMIKIMRRMIIAIIKRVMLHNSEA